MKTSIPLPGSHYGSIASPPLPTRTTVTTAAAHRRPVGSVVPLEVGAPMHDGLYCGGISEGTPVETLAEKFKHG